ncbi:conserved hypothetical protein [Actinacidiphila bryophytorum]|uniref:Uncharacterized protein n=1 Tax=Actinacidiphila bryophytorum TaxID=1436133 RepID=A0A9W4H065_9ACTN|nr:conserved hypothetical protein [Actinacidiphila bryophytorum]
MARGLSRGLCGGRRRDHRPRQGRPDRVGRGLPAGRPRRGPGPLVFAGEPAARPGSCVDPRADLGDARRRPALPGDRRRAGGTARRSRPGGAQRGVRLVDAGQGVRAGAVRRTGRAPAVHDRAGQGAAAAAGQPQTGVAGRALRGGPAARPPRPGRRPGAGRGLPAEPAPGGGGRAAAAAARVPPADRVGGPCGARAALRGAVRLGSALGLAPGTQAPGVPVSEPGAAGAGRAAGPGDAGGLLRRHRYRPRAAGGPGDGCGAACGVLGQPADQCAGHQRPGLPDGQGGQGPRVRDAGHRRAAVHRAAQGGHPGARRPRLTGGPPGRAARWVRAAVRVAAGQHARPRFARAARPSQPVPHGTMRSLRKRLCDELRGARPGRGARLRLLRVRRPPDGADLRALPGADHRTRCGGRRPLVLRRPLRQGGGRHRHRRPRRHPFPRLTTPYPRTPHGRVVPSWGVPLPAVPPMGDPHPHRSAAHAGDGQTGLLAAAPP